MSPLYRPHQLWRKQAIFTSSRQVKISEKLKTTFEFTKKGLITDPHPGGNALERNTGRANAHRDSSWRQIVCVGAVVTEGNDLLRPVVPPVLCQSHVPIASFSKCLSLGNNGDTLEAPHEIKKSHMRETN
ncbi:hypothetical protein Q8A67_002979 [Cirrhinus molitorella]|uniref:Uncharacterized protein n=1 Tax=Cirrhinus molitorella TaxID=172907 RepID=A0AA88TVV1_9TELE|nr:hypothetical protein Q8A67_002979 [Cirrhinus molitorella]